MSENELFYLIFTPLVIALFIYAAYAEGAFQKAKQGRVKTISPEEWQKKLAFVGKQTKDIKCSANNNTRCGCGNYLNPVNSFRCLYCSELYCKKCAENHFGKTIKQHRLENPIQE